MIQEWLDIVRSDALQPILLSLKILYSIFSSQNCFFFLSIHGDKTVVLVGNTGEKMSRDTYCTFSGICAICCSYSHALAVITIGWIIKTQTFGRHTTILHNRENERTYIANIFLYIYDYKICVCIHTKG